MMSKILYFLLLIGFSLAFPQENVPQNGGKSIDAETEKITIDTINIEDISGFLSSEVLVKEFVDCYISPEGCKNPTFVAITGNKYD